MSDTQTREQKFEIEFQATGGLVRLNPTIVRKYLVQGKRELVEETEIVMFMQLCRYQGLNPFLRDAYLIKYSSNEPATVVVGKDTFTKRAGAIRECGGFNAGVIVATKENGKQTITKRTGSMVYPGEELVGGWGHAYRKGWKEPIEIEVSLKEYMRWHKRKDGVLEPTRSWREMPATMIRKVALVQVLRETFAEHYANMYSAEEMPVEPSELPQQPVQVPDTEKVFLRDVTPPGNNVPQSEEPSKTKEEEPAKRQAEAEPKRRQEPPTQEPETPTSNRAGQFVGRGAGDIEPDADKSKEKMEGRIDAMRKEQEGGQEEFIY